MATQTLNVKFGTLGLPDVKRDIETALQRYVDYSERVRALVEKQEEYRSRAAAIANKEIETSYKTLSTKTTIDILEAKAAFVKSFEAIRNSGVASAQAITAEYLNLTQTLKVLVGAIAKSVTVTDLNT